MSFNPAASNFSTSRFIADRGTYQLLISDVRARKVDTKDGPRGIVSFGLRMESDPYRGKPLSLDCFVGPLDDEDSIIEATADTAQMMQVVLSALGIKPGAEGDEIFRSNYAGFDLDVDFARKVANGSDWARIKGCSFVADLGQKVDTKDSSKIYQTFNSIRPASA